MIPLEDALNADARVSWQEAGAERFAYRQKAGVGAQIHRSQTWCYISACHGYREESPGSLVFKSIINGD